MSKVQYKHIRNWRYEYGIDHSLRWAPVAKGGVTLAYWQQPCGKYRIGMSLCSANDAFRRDVGRAIAEQRMITNIVLVDEDYIANLESLRNLGFDAFDIHLWDLAVQFNLQHVLHRTAL